MGLDEAADLHREWRAIVLDKLSSLETGQKELKSEIVDIKTSFVRQQHLDTMRQAYQLELEMLRSKIEKLDYFKAKAIGIMIGVQGVLIVAYHLFTAFHK